MVEGEKVRADVYWRADLQPGMQLEGPAIVVDSMFTTVIDSGWRAEIYSGGELVLRDQGSHPVAMIPSAADPVFAGSVQQPLLGHCGTNGDHVTAHLLQRECQGTF